MATERAFKRILVPTDFSAQSEQAWTVARALAHALDAELVLAHVLVEGPLFSEGPFAGQRVREIYDAARLWAEGKLEEWLANARADGLAARTIMRVGIPYREIVALADEAEADVIVIGTHGRGGIDRALLGSVADRVVRLASCPVLMVRASA